MSKPRSRRATIRALREAVRALMPEHHLGQESDNAPCNATCRFRKGEDHTDPFARCLHHRRDLEPRRGPFVSDRCTAAPEISEHDEMCLRCIALDALRPSVT
jgi:hypothetical protein